MSPRPPLSRITWANSAMSTYPAVATSLSRTISNLPCITAKTSLSIGSVVSNIAPELIATSQTPRVPLIGILGETVRGPSTRTSNRYMPCLWPAGITTSASPKTPSGICIEKLSSQGRDKFHTRTTRDLKDPFSLRRKRITAGAMSGSTSMASRSTMY